MPHFVSQDGRILSSTANYLWERLASGTDGSHHTMKVQILGKQAREIFCEIQESAVKEAEKIYDQLVGFYNQKIRKEEEKMWHAFEARRASIKRLGLESVRVHRLKKLENEIEKWKKMMDRKKKITPELSALIIVGVDRARR